MFKADYAEMKSSAVTISKSAKDYKESVDSLYQIVDNLVENWKGEDNVKFAETVNGYKEDMKSLGDIVDDYSVFLNKAVAVISETQDEITAAAGRL